MRSSGECAAQQRLTTAPSTDDRSVQADLRVRFVPPNVACNCSRSLYQVRRPDAVREGDYAVVIAEFFGWVFCRPSQALNGRLGSAGAWRRGVKLCVLITLASVLNWRGVFAVMTGTADFLVG